ALLIEALARAYRETGNALFATRIEETIDWLKAEMLTTEGGFSASLDADSEGQEGRFYVWHRSEIESILGPDADLFCEVYDIATGGNWAGVSIPNRSRFGRALAADETERLAVARTTLASARATRPRPGLDDKVLADWNGFAIAAIADAAALFDRTDWLELATGAYRFVAESMTRDGRLGHAWRTGKLTFPGLSSDVAAMARAATVLFETTGEAGYLADAERFVAALDAHHRAEAGGYHLAADDADDLVLRIRTGADDAVPNPNAVAAETMVRLWLLTGRERYRDGADSILAGFAADIARNPASSFGLLNAFDFRLDPTIVVIVGPPADRAALRRACHETRGLSAVLFETESVDDLPAGHPAHGKTTAALTAAAFVCRGGTCSLPVGDPIALGELMRQR
ncbi:MAG TPA: thioredoxin domain-containing protein, partial [Kaistiaceae bacterium]|nr:thioredoxin domain-containing protein [Kaistiaceae bacterium]